MFLLWHTVRVPVLVSTSALCTPYPSTPCTFVLVCSGARVRLPERRACDDARPEARERVPDGRRLREARRSRLRQVPACEPEGQHVRRHRRVPLPGDHQTPGVRLRGRLVESRSARVRDALRTHAVPVPDARRLALRHPLQRRPLADGDNAAHTGGHVPLRARPPLAQVGEGKRLYSPPPAGRSADARRLAAAQLLAVRFLHAGPDARVERRARAVADQFAAEGQLADQFAAAGQLADQFAAELAVVAGLPAAE